MSDEYAKKQALDSTETVATVVNAIIRTQYGDEAYLWDPSTVYLETRADFKAEPSANTMDRWSAMQVIMTSDAFFKRPDAFFGICNTLGSGAPFFQVFDPVTVEEAAWAITEVAFNRELLPFSYAVRTYLKTILKQDGYEENDYPAIFKEVFEVKPDTGEFRAHLRELSNRENVEVYIDEQLKDMVYQFNQIPSLSDVDDMLLHRSKEEYIGTMEV